MTEQKFDLDGIKARLAKAKELAMDEGYVDFVIYQDIAALIQAYEEKCEQLRRMTKMLSDLNQSRPAEFNKLFKPNHE